MTDAKIRHLERQAKNGDLNAALQLYYEQKRHGKERVELSPKIYAIDLNQEGIQGRILVIPHSSTEIEVQSPVVTHILIHGLYFNLSATLFYNGYYAGWGFRHESGRNSYLLTLPENAYQDAPPSYTDLMQEVLLRIIPEWIVNHPKEIAEAHRINIHNSIVKTARNLELQLESIRRYEQDLASLIVEELRD